MTLRITALALTTLAAALTPTHALAQMPAPPLAALAPSDVANPGANPVEYRVLATNRTGTMLKELNEAAAEGFRFVRAMKGDTAFGGDQVVSVLERKPGATAPQYEYRLLATSKTSTMQKELQEAGDAGFVYRDQTIGGEVIVILERDREAPIVRYDYRLLATSKTSTMEKELQKAAADGYEFVGVTVADTAFGGSEVVSIMRKRI